ncbi:MAG: beta-galactosidase [Betaproteobacteria bacterium]|nr:beta-galactosidase [Betaproteobacteria bacterium]
MKLRFFLALFGSIVLAQASPPAMALQCTSKPIDLIVKARAEQTVESNILDCTLEGEAAIHLTGKLASSLVRARGYIKIRFLNQQGKQLWTSRQGPWLGTFSGLALGESIIVPPGAMRVHVVAQIESVNKETVGKWCIAGLTISPGIVVTGKATEGTVISTAQTVRWRFSTVPAEARGEFHIELRDLARRIKKTRTIAKTGIQTEIDLGMLPVGYYQVLAQFTPEYAHTGMWTSALVVLPNDVSPNEPRFGMDGALSWYRSGKLEAVKQSVKMMRQAGIGTVRDRMAWSQIQPTRERLGWEPFEEVAKTVAQAGMELVQVFHDSPVWTRPGGRSQTNQQVPIDNTAVFEFGQAFAKGLGKTVRSIEYWNEQNSGFFRGYPFQYTNGLKSFYAGVKSIDPNIRVLIGAAAGQPGQFFRETYQNNAANFFDVRNLHYYREINELDDFLNSHTASMERNAGVSGRPGWITETGFSLHRDAHGDWETAERKQAEYLVKTYAAGFAAGYERVFFFFWGELTEGNLHTWGILREDFSPRPAYLTLALLTRHLAGASTIASERHGTGRTVYFRRSDGSLVAVTWGGGALINRFGSKVEVHDIFGQRLDGASIEINNSIPLLLSQIDKLPEQVKRVNFPKQALRGLPPLWLNANMLVEGNNTVYLSGDKTAASVSDGKSVEITGRAYLTNSGAEKLTIGCIPGPGLVLLSPAQYTIEHPRPDGETFTCRFQANLMAVGKSYAMAQVKSESGNDIVRIALTPDITSTKATNITTHPLMPNSACPRWIPKHSKNIDLTIERAHSTPETCSVTITSRISQSGNSWVFPAMQLPASGLDAMIGVRLQIARTPGWSFPPTLLRLQLIEKTGGIWVVDLQNESGGKVYSGLFILASQASWARDNNGRLDLGDVQQILVGWGGHNGVVGQRYGFTIEAIDTLLTSQ